MIKTLRGIGIALSTVAILIPILTGWMQARASGVLADVFQVERVANAENQARIYGVLQFDLPVTVREHLLKAFSILGSKPDRPEAENARAILEIRLAQEAAGSAVSHANSRASLSWPIAIVLACIGGALLSLSFNTTEEQAQAAVEGAPGLLSRLAGLGRPLDRVVSVFDAFRDAAVGALLLEGEAITWVNPAFCRFVGVEEQYILGQPLEVVRWVLGAGQVVGDGEESITVRCRPGGAPGSSRYTLSTAPIKGGEDSKTKRCLMLVRSADEDDDAGKSSLGKDDDFAAIYESVVDVVATAALEIEDLTELKQALGSIYEQQELAEVLLGLFESVERLSFDKELDEKVRGFTAAMIEGERYASVREKAERFVKLNPKVAEAKEKLDYLASALESISERLRSLPPSPAKSDSHDTKG